MQTSQQLLQQDQPDGVQPLPLTGERTLPDIPQENYWFQRHLVVYQWIARQLIGQDVVDLACGEGYGTAVLARQARSVIGVDANPDAYQHAQAKYGSNAIKFERVLVETWSGEIDAVVFLQTIEHMQDPDAMLENIRSQITPDGVAFISTPNVLTLAPPGQSKSDNPWHIKEYRPQEFAQLCRTHFASVELWGVHHARKLLLHQFAIKRLGWDALHPRLRITRRFYDWFVPAIDSHDFSLQRDKLARALDFVAVLRP